MSISDDDMNRIRFASVRDDCFQHLVPGHVRELVAEIDRLRKENAELSRMVAADNEAAATIARLRKEHEALSIALWRLKERLSS